MGMTGNSDRAGYGFARVRVAVLRFIRDVTRG
jgi:hypothetical protein